MEHCCAVHVLDAAEQVVGQEFHLLERKVLVGFHAVTEVTINQLEDNVQVLKPISLIGNINQVQYFDKLVAPLAQLSQ